MKFIRKYLKILIAESISENFPTINICISEQKDHQSKVVLHDCIFRSSTIKLSKEMSHENVDIHNCSIDMDGKKEPFIQITEDK